MDEREPLQVSDVESAPATGAAGESLSQTLELAPAYTPAGLLKAVQAVLIQRDPGSRRPTRLRAIPSRKQEELYGGYAYVQLRDPHTNAYVEGRLPEKLVPVIEWGREAVLTGLVDYRTAIDKVSVQFLITGLEAVGEARQAGKEDLMRAWRTYVEQSKRQVEVALQKDRPRVAIVTGVHGIVIDDVRRELQECEAEIELIILLVPRSSRGCRDRPHRRRHPW